MSEKSSFGKLDVHLTAGSDIQDGTPSSEVPFRICILGDFSGQGGREDARARPAKLRPILIDRDNFDEVLQKLSPEAHLQLGTSGHRLILRFQSLEDFHPDQILSNVSLFSKLRETRKKVNNPSTFAAGAAEVRRWAEAPEQKSQLAAHNDLFTNPVIPAKAGIQPGEKKPAEDQQEDHLSAGFLLDGLAERGHATAHSGLGDFEGQLRKIVQPHLAPRDDPQQPELISRVDAAIGELMEAILHHPEFQALEAAWRGVHFLVTHLDTGTDLKVYLIDLTKEELASDLKSSEDLSRTAFHKVLVEETVQTPGADPWAL